MGTKGPADARQIVASNRRARYDYDIIDTYEAGIATPMFGLDSVMFHLRRGPAPRRRTRDGNRRPDWEALDLELPVLAATWRDNCYTHLPRHGDCLLTGL